MKAAACPFLRPGDKIGGQAAFFRRLADEGAVVAGDAQRAASSLPISLPPLPNSRLMETT